MGVLCRPFFCAYFVRRSLFFAALPLLQLCEATLLVFVSSTNKQRAFRGV
jgi:hypothetical protein